MAIKILVLDCFVCSAGLDAAHEENNKFLNIDMQIDKHQVVILLETKNHHKCFIHLLRFFLLYIKIKMSSIQIKTLKTYKFL